MQKNKIEGSWLDCGTVKVVTIGRYENLSIGKSDKLGQCLNGQIVRETELYAFLASVVAVTMNAAAAQVRDALGAQTAVTRDRLTIAASVSSSSRRAVSTVSAAELAAIDEALEGLGLLLRQGAADAVSPQSDLASRFLSGLAIILLHRQRFQFDASLAKAYHKL